MDRQNMMNQPDCHTASSNTLDNMQKPYSISSRLAVSLTVMVLIISTIAATAIYFNAQKKMTVALEKEADAMIGFLIGAVTIPIWDLNEQALRSVGDTLLQNNLVASLKVMSHPGNLVFSNVRKRPGEKCIQKRSQVSYNGKMIGEIQLELTTQPLQKCLNQLLWNIGKITLLIVFSILFFTRLLIRRYLNKPLKDFDLITQEYAAGRYDSWRGPLPYKELKEYGKVLVKLGNMIEQQMRSLRESEEKYRVLFETFPLGITISDKTGKIIETNCISESLLGIAKSDHERRTIDGHEWEIVHSDGTPFLQEEFPSTRALREKRKIENAEMGILRLDGTITWLNVTATPIPLKNYGVAITYGDITDRKQAENEIINQKRLFETMFNTIPDGVVITNKKREIQLANKGMEKTFGYKPEELIGKAANILYATQDKFKETGKIVFDKDCRTIKDAKNPGDLYICSYKDKDGREFSGETFAAKLFNDADQWVGNLGIMRDITEREQAEMRIQQAQKMESIGTLAGGIAHDFNNLLSPIIGMSEMMLEDLEPDSSMYENTQEIYKAGNRAKDLVSQILSFSRQTEHETMPVKFQNVLKEVLKLCRSTIPTNIEIEQEIQQDCGLIWANSTQLHQIGMNLITNAYHAVQDKNGKITLTLQEIILEKNNFLTLSVSPGKYALLSVSDNGSGMSEEIKSKIFEPYFTTKVKGKGTGLGLSVVYGIVKKFGGDIQVSSEEDSGTTFNIYLPLMKKTDDNEFDHELISLKSEMKTGDEHILLVDDEPSITKLVQLMLERLGYTVTARVSSIEGLEAFKENPDKFDLVVSDMSMPSMTGDQLAHQIRQIRPEVPIIICTGFSERINKENAEEIGVNGFLMKPIVKFEMAEMIRNVLDENKGGK